MNYLHSALLSTYSHTITSVYDNYYFKGAPGERLMSGTTLESDIWDTLFINCKFHILHVSFIDCVFIDCIGIDSDDPHLADCTVITIADAYTRVISQHKHGDVWK